MKAADITTLCNNNVLGNCPGSAPYHPADIKLYNFYLSEVDAFRVVSVDGTVNPPKINFSGAPILGILNGGRYLIMNSREYFLSNRTPGTFYLDCGASGPCITNGVTASDARIYYLANPGENPLADLILAPQAQQILTDMPAAPVRNSGFGYLSFEGITFMGDNYVTAANGYAGHLGQPNVTAAVSFVDTTGVTVDTSSIGHTSGWGMEFTNDHCTIPPTPDCPMVTGPSAQNQLTSSAIFDVGASALRIGRYPDATDSNSSNGYATQFTTVYNNIFSGTGRLYPGGEDGCILIGSSHDNVITYNNCIDSYGGGIGIGPSVGQPGGGVTYDYVYSNVVSYNRFQDIGEGVISDFGCVHFANYGGIQYFRTMIPPQTPLGNTFSNNVCHDLTQAENDPAGAGIGIYIDNNSQLNIASYNLVYRASGSLYFNHSSPDCYYVIGGGFHSCQNTVASNVLAYAGQGPIKRAGGDTVLDFTFQNNVVYFDLLANTGPQLLSSTSTWDCNVPTTCTSTFNFQSNDYWSTLTTGLSFQYKHGGSTTNTNFDGWSDPAMTAQEDNVSPATIIADPGFVSPGRPFDDYHFRDSSATGVPGKIGFDFVGFGYTYSAGRRSPSSFAPPSSPGFPLQLLPASQF
ncbi:MAG: hypothetical protein H0X25_09180 [Acidobacteriales bacterium]|nr:hypothetical protein [Terriglobales bacterium]